MSRHNQWESRDLLSSHSTPTTTFNHKYTNNTNRTNSQPIVELRTLILGSHVGPESLTQTQFYILGKRSKDKDQIYKAIAMIHVPVVYMNEEEKTKGRIQF